MDERKVLQSTADEKTEENLLLDWVAALPAPFDTEMRALYDEMCERKTLEAQIYKALDNMEGVLAHNESAIETWEPHEYELTKNYGIDKTQFHPYIKRLRECMKKETEDKIAAAGRRIVFAVPDTLTIFSHRVAVVRVLGSKFLLYHFGIKAVIILKYHGDTN